MTPQELRTSIYQLAFRGKLVAQFPEEGTAEELFSIISTKYLSKKIAAPKVENEDELPFEIPDTWKWVHLNHIATSNLGKTLDKVKNTGELCPYLCSINVYWDGISLEKVKEARFEETEREKYLLQKGDLLVCEGGDVGRSAIWESDQVMYYQNALHRIRFFADIEPYFYKYLLECYKGMGIIDRYSKGVTIKHLVQNALYAMWLPLPPLAEQRRIVAKLEEILPLIDRYETAWNKLEEFNKRFPGDMQKSILQLAMQGKLVPQIESELTQREVYAQVQQKHKRSSPLPSISTEEIPYDIPDSWFWVRLGDALIIERGGSPRPIKAYITNDPNGINWIKIGDTEKGGKYINGTQEKIIPEGMKKSRYVQKGDFLLSNSMSFGRPYILNIDGCIHDGWLVLRPVLELFDKDYLYYLLSSPMVFAQFCSRVAGAVVNNLNSDKVALTVVPVPPLEEQKRIVAKLEEILPLCDRLK